MVVMEKKSERNVRSVYEAELLVERTDISFQDVAGNKVRIQVRVHNAGLGRSRPTPMILESAPFGAFVPWRPLAQLVVPALEPGESREMITEVKRPRPAPLGDFNRVPPQNLLTAINAPDETPPANSFVAALRNLIRRQQRADVTGDIAGQVTLAPDLWDLLGRSHQHWAGNINVWVGTAPVERHLAKALRIHPGHTNLAMFCVGTPGKREEFAFELVGLSEDWETALYNMTSQKNLLVHQAPIDETQWIESQRGLVVLLATRPPAHCTAGHLSVHVTRESDRKQAIVEFDLNSAAQGAGCYFL